MKHIVANIEDIPLDSRIIVNVRGRQIGVFNVKGSYYALQNHCPHQGAPVCMGDIDGTNLPSHPNEYRWGRKGEILRCPWHGWEFEISTGQSLFEPQIKLKTFVVEVEGSKIIIHL